MPVNNRINNPLPEQLTKDLYRINTDKKIILSAPNRIINKYKFPLDQIIVPLKNRFFYLRGENRLNKIKGVVLSNKFYAL
jgi:hypothetical protein